jgi:type III pantothenate kinase
VLLIGNSRWHWGESADGRSWRHWDGEAVADPPVPDGWAAVGPQPPAAAGDLWRQRQLTNRDVPLAALPDHVGIDRALAAWGAWTEAGGPVMVVDAGTALTLTVVDAQGRFLGGRILAGADLQLQALHRGTRQLPLASLRDATSVGEPWPRDTEAALRTGVAEGLASAVTGAWVQCPGGHGEGSPWSLWLTGGDGPCLEPLLQRRGLIVRHVPGLALDAMARLAGFSPVRDP